jgi:hypothetical protein
MSRIHMLSLSLFVLAVGCGGGDDPDTGSEVQGLATYRDATTDAAGASREPASPPAQSARVTVTVRGNGTLTGLDPTCLEQATGQFHAVYDGTAEVDGNGGYVSSMAAADALLQTPSGCAIPDLTVGAVTDVVVRAELDVTTANCTTYCEASARADAEAECTGAADRAGCWASAESAAMAACQTECTTQSEHIVAEATIAGSALGELDIDALRAAALGELEADLTFDTLE